MLKMVNVGIAYFLLLRFECLWCHIHFVLEEFCEVCNFVKTNIKGDFLQAFICADNGALGFKDNIVVNKSFGGI